MSLEFLLTSLVIVASPGTGVLVTLAAGLSHGTRASVIAAFGCTLGIIPHMLAAMTGLAALLHTSASAFEAVKYAGVAYLLYMSWMTLRENGTLKVATDDQPRSDTEVIWSAILVNVLNPKLSIFFFAFLPQFVGAQDANPLPRMIELSLIFMAMTFVVFAFYGMFASAVRHHIISRPAVIIWMRRTFAAAFVLLAAKLTFADR